MSDPLERMAGFRSDIEGGPMLPADEVRRRGDRIRRRRRTAVAAGSALAVAAIAIPIALATTGGSPDRIDPAPPPTTPTQAEEASTLTEANLMTDGDTEFDGQARWARGETTTSESDRASDPCLGSPVGELGAEALFERSWGLEAHGLNQVVAEFPSAADAREAYEAINEPRVDCKPFDARPSGDNGYLSGEGTMTAIPVADEAMVWEATFSLSTDEGGEAFADHRVFLGVAFSGERLTVLYHDMPEAEYGWGDVSPVERMLPTAAQRLVGGEPPATDDNTTTPPDAASNVLDDSHLVEAGALPAVPDREAWEQIPPQSLPTLICQGGWLSSLDPTDTVTRELRIPEPRADYDLGAVNVAVLTFVDREAADAAYGTVTGWLERCPASQEDTAEPRVDTQAAAVDVPGADRAHQVRVDYFAPEVCPDGGCDAAWFDHQTVAQVDDRLVLVTYAELAGPCPPGDACPETEQSVRPWFERVAVAVEAAVGRAGHDRP